MAKKNPFNRYGQVLKNHDLARKIISNEVKTMTPTERSQKYKQLTYKLHTSSGTTLALNDRGRLTLLELKKARRK